MSSIHLNKPKLAWYIEPVMNSLFNPDGVNVASPRPKAFALWLCTYLGAKQEDDPENVCSRIVYIPKIGKIVLHERSSVFEADSVRLAIEGPMTKAIMAQMLAANADATHCKQNFTYFRVLENEVILGFIRVSHDGRED